MNQQQKLIILAGGSAFIFILGLAYFLSKKDEEFEDDDEEDEILDDSSEKENKTKSTRSELPDLNAAVASAAQFSVDIDVPKRIVGSIIGKGGSNIKQLRNEFAVRLNFEKEDELTEEEKESKPVRKLTIKGEREKVLECEQKVKKIISDTPEFITAEVFVPQEACGQIIGKSGQSIREMCSISGAKINLERDVDPTLNGLRRVEISGASTQVDYAKLLIEEKVEVAKKLKAKDELRVLSSKQVADAKPENVAENLPQTYKCMPFPEPDENGYFKVFVSAYDTPDRVWIQPCTTESLKLEALNEKLKLVYGNMSKNQGQLMQGKKGELCVAQHKDGEWYRATIVSINRDRTAEVLFIDYGNVILVNLDDVKAIKPEYKELPACASECYLPIRPKGNPYWTQVSETHFKKLIHYGGWIAMYANVLGEKDINGKKLNVIEVIHLEQEEDICDHMVQSNHAEYDDEFKTTKSKFAQQQKPSADVVTPEILEIPEIPILEDVIQPESIHVVEEENVIPSTEDAIESSIEIIEEIIPLDVESNVESAPEIVEPVTRNSEEVSAERNNVEEAEGTLLSSKLDDTLASSDTLESTDSGITKDLKSSDSQDPQITTAERSMPDLENVGKQASVDDSFVDIDMMSVDGAVKAVVSDHIPPVTPQKVGDSNVDESTLETPVSTNVETAQATSILEDEVDKKGQSDNNEDVVQSAIDSTDDRIEVDVPVKKEEETLVEENLPVAEDEDEDEDEDEEHAELQRSLDETSKKNVFINSSMEMARENLILLDNGDSSTDNDSFYSARSDVTLTDTDNLSFMTATDRMTPSNEISFSIPDLTNSSPYGSQTDLTKSRSKSDLSTKSKSRNSLGGSKFEIQFIDEKTHKVMSRESLTASFEASGSHMSKQQKRLSAPRSPGKETPV
eukprot:TCONS_00027297-protein